MSRTPEQGCERVFQESMSGTRVCRPQLAAALEFARQGMSWVVGPLYRMARSMRQTSQGIRVYCA